MDNNRTPHPQSTTKNALLLNNPQISEVSIISAQTPLSVESTLPDRERSQRLAAKLKELGVNPKDL